MIIIQTKEEVLTFAKEQNVKLIRLWFSDILGVLKSFAIPISEFEDSLDNGTGFDGSSIEGYRDIEESDVIAKPDPTTFVAMPWRNSETVTARIFCDVLTPDGKPFIGDPRYILKQQVKKANDLGYTPYIGPELEYFYFKSNAAIHHTDSGGYFFITPTDHTEHVRQATVEALQKMGITVECSHHEVAPSQHEIDLRYDEALTMADQCQTYKMVVKEVAKENGLYATFMPKPIFGKNGSGMHTHQSLFRGETNAMFDPNDAHHLSDIGKQYIAGVLKHAQEITTVTNPSINSYKRLVPGYEAPIYVAWSRANRTAMVRIPNFRPGNEKATRMELRSPDPSGNPYLQFAVMMAAGLKGIKEKYELPKPVDKNIFNMKKEEVEALNIDTLPSSLGEAVALTKQSQLVREALGDHAFERFIAIKEMEWDKYRIQVTDYELKKLLPKL